MQTLVFIIIFIVALIGYGAMSILTRKASHGTGMMYDDVLCVEAGGTSSVDPQFLKDASYKVKHVPIKDKTGKVINGKDTIRLKVNGVCMEPRGIHDGDELIAVRINNLIPFEKQVKRDDILLIHIEDKDINKIRIFDDFAEDNSLKTYRYEEGVRKNSSRNHKIESVQGVVKFVLC